MWGSRDPLLEF